MAEYITIGLLALVAVLCVVLLVRKPTGPATGELEQRLTDELREGRKESNAAFNETMRTAGQAQLNSQQQAAQRQERNLQEMSAHLGERQELLQRAVGERLAAMEKSIHTMQMQNEQKLENIRTTMEQRVGALQQGNEKKLEEMRQTVDEKLQRTLDERLKQSFSLVNESLNKVQSGLGEMQTLAAGVGDLKKVLSNVKTRGMLGEIQLGAILEEILAPEQYETNVATVPGSAARVEFAVKMPGDVQGQSVWLPIDAKFPSDAYSLLLEAYDAGDAAGVEEAGKTLEGRIRLFAKEIHEKYICVPHTTEFGIMFLPVEGLYAEVVRRGLVETLQRDYKVNIAGPTTMAALLNSLQMGFRTLAIQKRSGEVWKVLGEVKTEFGKFTDYLSRTKKHIDQASADIDHLIGTRSNQMQRKLREVTELPSELEAAGGEPPDLLQDDNESAAGAE